MSKDVAGLNGFIWWIGVIEDREDPLKLGRCKVRIVGWHSGNKAELPTSSLPWAQAMLPLNNPNPYAPKEGDMIVGFFIDGENGQEPVMMGVLPGIPLAAANPQQAFNDPRTPAQLAKAPVKPGEKATNYPRVLDEPSTSRLARNDAESINKTLVKTKKDNKVGPFELDTSYNAKYPYNNVYESESGHVMEFDDTPTKERVQIYHRAGTYMEIQPDGSFHFKSAKNSNETVNGNQSVYIKGNLTVVVDGNISFESKKNINFKAAENFSVSAQNISLSAKQNFTASGGSAASLIGKTKTSVGSMTSQTSVTGMITKVSGIAMASVTGKAVLNLGSSGISNLNGSMVNLLGSPVGGDVGADAGVQDLATSDVATDMSSSLSDSLSSISSSFTDIPVDASSLTDNLSNIGTSIQEGITSSLDSVQSNLSSLGDGVNFDSLDTLTDTELTSLVDVDTDTLSNVLDNAQTYATDMMSNIQENLSTLTDNVGDKLSSVTSNLTGPLKEGLSKMEGKYSILSSDTASLGQKLAAAKDIAATGTQMVTYAASLPGKATSELSGYVNSSLQSLASGISNSDTVKSVKEKLGTTYDSYVEEIRANAKTLGTNLNSNADKVLDEWIFQNRDAVIQDVAESGLTARQQGLPIVKVQDTMKATLQGSWEDYYRANQAKIAPLTNKAVQTSGEIDTTGVA